MWCRAPDCTLRVRYLFPNAISESFLQSAVVGENNLPIMIALQSPEMSDPNETSYHFVLTRLSQFLTQRESVGIIVSSDKVFALMPLHTMLRWFPTLSKAVPSYFIDSQTPLIMALMASGVQSRRFRNDPMRLLADDSLLPMASISSHRELFAHDIDLAIKGVKPGQFFIQLLGHPKRLVMIHSVKTMIVNIYKLLKQCYLRAVQKQRI
ncbi:hypothetical protein BDF19DRAFT_281944 [Syncephalis fuscata]|nr:hypothetical protein BDF19DRAFT_281944 [Syncephalis fuscata]